MKKIILIFLFIFSGNIYAEKDANVCFEEAVGRKLVTLKYSMTPLELHKFKERQNLNSIGVRISCLSDDQGKGIKNCIDNKFKTLISGLYKQFGGQVLLNDTRLGDDFDDPCLKFYEDKYLVIE